MKSVLNVLFGLLVGLASFVLWGKRAPAEDAANASVAATAQAQAVTAANPGTALDLQALRAEMHRVARQEIAESAGAHADDVSKKPVPEPTPQQTRAAADQSQLLAQAIQAGTWTDQDVARLREILTRMAPDQRFDALRSISQAINRGQLQVDARPPF
jgi:hypothetical protein